MLPNPNPQSPIPIHNPYLNPQSRQYGATVVALLVYAAPLYLGSGPSSTASQGELTQEYIRAMRLLSNTSKCVCVGGGDLHV